MKISASELASLLGGSVEGDADVIVDRPARIEDATFGTLSFLANPKYEEFAYQSEASILLVDRLFKPSRPIKATLVRVDNVYAAMAFLAEKFDVSTTHEVSVSSNAVIDSTAKIGKDVTIADFVVIGPDCVIGDGVVLHPFVYVGAKSTVGELTILHTGVKVHYNSQIGRSVTIHANSVIGSDGFGYVKTDGAFKKMKQLGNVIIEDDVEIGANVVIDRASLGSTVIRQGSKLDNLIQIAHNVEIGKHSAIAAQSGIAGSARIGNDVLIGGQVGIVGHIHIADGTQIQAQSGVNASTKENARLYGSPALEYNKYLRSYAVFRNLPVLSNQLNDLQQRLKSIEKEIEQLLANS
jgi:UDP-3-O-[3-hydroxymyristoyl] glucosamine N-acyltransferase